MDRAELLSLGVSTDLQTACRAIGISKSAGYALARDGKFPTRVIRAGQRYVVPTEALQELLGVVVGEPL